ncbi:hypothetical protein NDU88_004378 [Pleurodeles waltl]|uniref:Retinoid X receptor alpha n=1 Tax=Pleurodeles waltl TaxID=8319 RepID=A0AAV7MTA3_PLEWA|nr:hypothetical protein NDU88_004378 [Pleurodeles waltl]
MATNGSLVSPVLPSPIGMNGSLVSPVFPSPIGTNGSLVSPVLPSPIGTNGSLVSPVLSSPIGTNGSLVLSKTSASAPHSPPLLGCPTPAFLCFHFPAVTWRLLPDWWGSCLILGYCWQRQHM